MAKTPGSKLRYDDFVASVQTDPAKPVATTLLSGFVGQGTEGHARIYPDPSLGTWYDVPEDAIVHSAPIADSKLGGSNVWVKADAQIKPGSAAAAAAAVQPAVNITLLPTPATHCFICPPPHITPATVCTFPGHCHPDITLPNICTLHPTPATHCINCPPQTPMLTLAHICSAPGLCLPPPTPHCPPPGPTPASMCIICPQNTALPQCTIAGCFQDAGNLAARQAAVALPQTAATVCTQFGCPGLPHTAATVCTQFGCPGGPFTPATLCTHGLPCPGPHTAPPQCTHLLGCSFVGCTPHCPGGPGQGPFTPATLCTHGLPCPGPGGPFTPATLCTRHPPCPLPVTPATICPTVRCGVFNPFG